MPNTDPYRASFTNPEKLHVDELSFDGESVTIHAFTENPTAECPLCGRPSHRIHGIYTRTLADLPWSGIPVRLRLRMRKFFCDDSSCERRIFAERLPDMARIYARSTDRQREALEWIAFALGGEAGARLAREQGYTNSEKICATFIAELRRSEASGKPPSSVPRARKGSVAGAARR